jgi:ABC-2 type transport system permease protein
VTAMPKASRVLFQTMRIQLLLLLKTWPARLVDLLMPALVAFVPIILGSAIAGGEAGFNFARYAHTSNFAGFMLIGGGTFLLVTRAFWGFGNWVRQEMQSGTLESLYLAPASMRVVLAGVACAFIIYSTLMFIGALGLGTLLFQITFHFNHWLMALAFLLIGLPPTYGLALLYATLVLRLKETDALIQIAQITTSLLMGVYFPITLFPTALKVVSLLFPPTWLTQGLRGALLETPYLSGSWGLDLSILTFFCLITPLAGYVAFTRTEKLLRTGAGLGEF